MSGTALVCKYYTTEQACRNYCKTQNDCIEPLDNGKYCCQVEVVTREYERAFYHFCIAFMTVTAIISAVWVIWQADIQLSRHRQVTHFDGREIDEVVFSVQEVHRIEGLLRAKPSRAKRLT